MVGLGGLLRMAMTFHSSFAVHPGEWLRAEIVEPHELSVTATAEKLRVTRQAMSSLLNGKAGVSAEMAIRFEKAFGLRADTLLRMQAAHDLANARAHERDIRVERIAA
jgi:antitoxin HigA-1